MSGDRRQLSGEPPTDVGVPASQQARGWPTLIRSLAGRSALAAARGSTQLTQAERTQLENAGALLRQLRELARLTTADLAAAAGVSPGTVSGVERGRGHPRELLVARLARVLGQVLVADVLELGAGAFAEPSAEPGHVERVEAQRDAKAVSIRAVRRRRQLRIAAATGDLATLATQLDDTSRLPWSAALAHFLEQERTDHADTDT